MALCENGKQFAFFFYILLVLLNEFSGHMLGFAKDSAVTYECHVSVIGSLQYISGSSQKIKLMIQIIKLKCSPIHIHIHQPLVVCQQVVQDVLIFPVGGFVCFGQQLFCFFVKLLLFFAVDLVQVAQFDQTLTIVSPVFRFVFSH